MEPHGAHVSRWAPRQSAGQARLFWGAQRAVVLAPQPARAIASGMQAQLKPKTCVLVGKVAFGNDRPMALFAGPCQMESRQHALEMPAPVVADALGYHQVTTAKLAAQAGEPGAGTPPLTHLRSPSAELHRELTTVEDANLPVSSPGTPPSTSRALSHHQPARLSLGSDRYAPK